MTDPLIAIVAGHGGEKSGTCHGDLIEKDVNLQLAIELNDSLSSWRTALIRTADRTMTLRERGALTVDAGLTVCIHVNSSKAERAHGLTCYHWPGNTVAHLVAQAILDAAPHALRVRSTPIVAYDDPDTPDDDWIERPRAVLGAHRGTAVLPEVGFASNPRDRAYLLTRAGRSSAVTALRAGICRWLELET